MRCIAAIRTLPWLMTNLFQREVRAIASQTARLNGYTDELVSAQEPLTLRRALAGMEEAADRLLRDVRVLVHRAESLR
jgi:hypothetical protein